MPEGNQWLGVAPVLPDYPEAEQPEGVEVSMTPTCSIIHATLGRPEKAIVAMRMWFERAADPAQVEYVFAVNEDDTATRDALRYLDKNVASCPPFKCVVGQFKGSAEAWDAAAKASTGLLLIQASDDMEPPPCFDQQIIERLESACGSDWTLKPIVVAVSDGVRKDKLLTTFICTRLYAALAGCFIPSEYRSVHSDGEATYRAYKNQREEGRATVIEARDIVIFHRHHYSDKSVPWDETYARQNAPEAYESGLRLFLERNPEATKDGIVDWL